MEPKRCYGCMKLKTQSPLCEHCGYNEHIDNLSHQLPLGTILQGRYEIGKVLGQGGFGITYIGWDHARETAVAVKEFYPGGIVNRDASVSQALNVNSSDAIEAFARNRKRFLQEAYILQKLNDIPQIVHVENLFEENNTAYIIMELIRGVDLRRYIRMMGGKLSVSKTFDILCPIMEALHRAHESGLVHRDVGPDNIMLMPDGKAKLLDFGAAREVMAPELGQVQSTEAILKHGFAPIEQYQRSGALGPWTDVYALSATVYYCLTGQIPPDAPKRIMDGVEIPWNTIPGLSAWQAEVLRKAMEPMPRNRTRSIEEVRTALFAGPISGEQPWIEPEPAAKPVPKPEPVADPRSVIQEIPQSTYQQIPQSSLQNTPQNIPQSGNTENGRRKSGGNGLKHDPVDISGKTGNKKPWGKIAAIAAVAAVVILGAILLPKGGSGDTKAPGENKVSVIQQESSASKGNPEPVINKDIPSQVDMGAIFTGNPDRTITYLDGSRSEIYLTNDRETARALYDKDGALVYRFLADYNEAGDMLYQLTFDPENVCVRADTFTYNEDGNLITIAKILENGKIYQTLAYGYDDDENLTKIVTRDHNNEISAISEYFYENGTRVSRESAQSDGYTYEYTYNSEGQLASMLSYDENGEFSYRSEMVYDEEGRQIRQTSRSEDGKILRTTEFEYDAEGQRIAETSYNEFNEVEYQSKFIYEFGEMVRTEYSYSSGYSSTYSNMCDIDRNIIRSYDYGSYDYGYTYYTAWGEVESQISYSVETDELNSHSEYEYDEDYNFLGYIHTYYSSYDGSRTVSEHDADYTLIISREYDVNGNLRSWTEPEYDDRGNEIKSVTYRADGSIQSTYERTFNEKNEMIETRSTYYTESGSYTVYVMDKNYDTQSRTDYDANGNVKDFATYEYEYDARGNKTKQYVYDKDGKLDYWTEYFYDENGNYLDSEWHNA